MTSIKHILFFSIALFLFAPATAQRADKKQLDLADSYYNRGEFQKALLTYKKLYEAKPYSYTYVYKMVGTYQQLEQYENAKLLLEKRIEKTRIPIMLVELGYNYQLMDSISKAETLYQEAISTIDEKPTYIYGLGQRFEKHSLLPQAIKAYKKATNLLPEKNFSIQLARIYGDLGDVKNMFSNYIDYVEFKPNALNNIKRNLSQFVSENKDTENNKSLRVLLLKKIQSSPDSYWYEMLSWLYVQEKQYNKSFVQEKALYKRNPESLDRIIDLAITSKDDDDIETATDIFNYILETSQERDILLLAHQSLLEIQAENASQKELEKINETYLSLFNDFGKLESTLSLQLSYGQFLAFNLNKPKEASDFLKKSYKLDISPFQEGLVKLRLADILVLQEKFNEALIFYTQIKTSLKNSTIAQEAAYKIAKTSYYKGDFDWAESQLKVLKASTSQLIANDALDLKLLISDNKWDDTTQTALKYYAKADLLAFQNKTGDAIKLLDKILMEHNGESIIDETLFTQAKLHEKLNQFEKAEANYQKIIADYREDIFIDDAYYYLAELYNLYLDKPEEAKSLYKKIIFNHEDSIYFVEARKKFRMLRGDTIN
ncbi:MULTISPECIES: tetratricopeptide repeat protein [unclassified Winogradskyella]|uniref:tetratricopeptide repeat protein n=1 Tax=unclassified Winogradskyella TaxID=2615021 RepID=UPI001E2ACB3C|nr:MULTISPECIES: tetratricopeptide repeat protein [unclassified Winogradskyella]